MAELNLLEDNWKTLVLPNVLDYDLGAEVFREIKRKFGYGSKNKRVYHTLDRVSQLLHIAETYQYESTSPDVVKYAIWFHNMNHVPLKFKEHVSNSNDARKLLSKIVVLEKIVRETEYCILRLLNLHEDEEEDTDNSDLFLDVYLSVLGADSDTYDLYAEGLKKEVDWSARLGYKGRRSQWIQNLLEREHVYRTASFRTNYEAQAQKNLHRELESL